MKTYPLLDDAGETIGFQISNTFLPSSASVARFFAKCPGVEITRRRKIFEASEIHADFSFEGIAFIVWEPFGDNSRYWIGPAEGFENFETVQSSVWKLQDFVSQNWPGPISRFLGRVLGSNR